ncbi:glycoside hydrolase family 3 N-terminal domain-containing protein [Micromonospora cathayae]|uniref:Glycoside hydrolase family 3 N-terminal domain-containing protein n=1 Tax=Micromonospora cathayae TaxID=3028804 RepID=A0ABY7ZNP1_9ACTN|nr:glycoside hydrolase family 3 N-terminal domain-containing protein [Micromonospora sp. HUAS 3]WDZ83514.1 glycoside hydrolase family 3 N-terminal domain-containing protein [Micromonospora sp. HUAS 3]
MESLSPVDHRPESPGTHRWRDPHLPPAERAAALVPLMTLPEKIAQLVGVWVGADASGEGVAPLQSDMVDDTPQWPAVIRHGLGQLTRPFGTAPVDPVQGARSLAASQEEIVAASRFGIPAQVHEECLTGFAAWRATVYPAPLSWGAAFDPELVEEMAGRIGRSMRAAGVHQGLAPVLDVTRDYRWGRTEETIGEDPYLVGTTGAAYVRGLESTGIVATLKHFAGYSASRGGRNLAPVPMGRRELADVILPPFEMALRLGGARSVMHSYAEIDGLPVAADEGLLTRLLRDEWGFTGTVVADYFAVRFLETLHGVAGGAVDAARLALRAGIDVELPTVDAFGPLAEAVRDGLVDEALVDRALHRVLTQKIELGLLDDDWRPRPADLDELRLDDETSRDVALRLARESVVLLRNTGNLLPLAGDRRVALVGPVADDPMAMLGCYSFPLHVGVHHPDHGTGVEIDSLRDALARLHPTLTYAPGCAVTGDDTSGIAAAVAAAREADVCVLAVGDRAGMFGRGTSGEGCDAVDLRLPGVQADLVRAVLATGTPVVLVLMSGRPYALGADVDAAAAVVQAFFPGQRGGRALAEVLTGRVNPSGRLPVGVPRDAGGLPGTYLAPVLGHRSQVSSVDPTAAFPFGHGLSYTTFDWTDAAVRTAGPTGADAPTGPASPNGPAGTAGPNGANGADPSGGPGGPAGAAGANGANGTDPAGGPAWWAVDGEVTVEVTVRNTGGRAGTEVVQLYLHDPVAQTTRPVVRLVGYTRVPLVAGDAARVVFTVPADVTSFTGVRGRRIVEPGDVELRLARSSADVVAALPLRLVGAEREVGHHRRLVSSARVEPVVRPPAG